ncbi:MAG TPA: IclR family transcriptional regulator [Galbitalea sp.]|nr:IclR family transcriptional regulator [Galbitalea sp.]
MDDDDSKGRGSLDRALAILNHLAQVRQASMTELIRAADLSRSSAYRLVERLQAVDYLVQDSSGQWRLGPAAARLAMAAVQTTEVVDVAPEYLRMLVQQTRETVGLAVLSGDEMIFVYRELGPQSVQVNTQIGARRPLHASAVGKAFLSGLPTDESSSLIKRLKLESYTPDTIVTRAALEADIAQSRARGWSEDIREFHSASRCCGAPIFDYSGRVVAAMSVSGLADRMSPQQVGPLIAATADAISRRLGYVPERIVDQNTPEVAAS